MLWIEITWPVLDTILSSIFEILFELVITCIKHLFELVMAIFSKEYRTRLNKSWNESLMSKIGLIIGTAVSIFIIGFTVKLFI